MKRLHVICEGQTEQTFVRDVLAPAYHGRNLFINPILIGKARDAASGGDVRFGRLKADLICMLKQDPGSYCTTFIDYFRLGGGFPGYPVTDAIPAGAKAKRVETSIRAAVVEEMGHAFNPARLYPYIQMHEYEALLFSAPGEFADAIYRPDLIAPLRRIADEYDSPEEIDEGPETAPSKRVLRVAPDYQKVLDGARAAGLIGLLKIREKCPHFAEWLEWIERL